MEELLSTIIRGESADTMILEHMLECCKEKSYHIDRQNCFESIWKQHHQMEINRMKQKKVLLNKELELWKTKIALLREQKLYKSDSQ